MSENLKNWKISIFSFELSTRNSKLALGISKLARELWKMMEFNWKYWKMLEIMDYARIWWANAWNLRLEIIEFEIWGADRKLKIVRISIFNFRFSIFDFRFSIFDIQLRFSIFENRRKSTNIIENQWKSML